MNKDDVLAIYKKCVVVIIKFLKPEHNSSNSGVRCK